VGGIRTGPLSRRPLPARVCVCAPLLLPRVVAARRRRRRRSCLSPPPPSTCRHHQDGTGRHGTARDVLHSRDRQRPVPDKHVESLITSSSSSSSSSSTPATDPRPVAWPPRPSAETLQGTCRRRRRPTPWDEGGSPYDSAGRWHPPLRAGVKPCPTSSVGDDLDERKERCSRRARWWVAPLGLRLLTAGGRRTPFVMGGQWSVNRLPTIG
jgi:hypothetical protein